MHPEHDVRRSCIFSADTSVCSTLCSSEDSKVTYVIMGEDVNLTQTTKHRWPFRTNPRWPQCVNANVGNDWCSLEGRLWPQMESILASLIHVQVHASGACLKLCGKKHRILQREWIWGSDEWFLNTNRQSFNFLMDTLLSSTSSLTPNSYKYVFYHHSMSDVSYLTVTKSLLWCWSNYLICVALTHIVIV